MSENFRSLYGEYHKGQAQFAYFLLGVAVSAIAFTVHMTSDRLLFDTPWHYGAAVFFWGSSFLAGCAGIERRQDGLSFNAKFIQAVDELHPNIRAAPGMKEAIVRFKHDVTAAGTKAIWRFTLQRWFLFLGAVFFIAGHIYDMADRVPDVLAGDLI